MHYIQFHEFLIQIIPLLQNGLNFYYFVLSQKKQMIGIEQHVEKPSHGYQVKRYQQGISRLNPERISRNESSKQLQIDVQKILLTEIKKANEITDKIQYELNKDNKTTELTLIDQLRDIEESIRRKTIVIKQLENQVNFLKNGKNKAKYQNINFSLTEELKNYSVGVIELKKQLAQKRKLINMKWQQIKETKQKYVKKCKKQQKEVIEYAKFKEDQEKRKRDLIKLEKTRFNNNTKKYISSIWDERKIQGLQFDKVNLKSESIREFLNKKNVAEGALKNQRKKHKQQMISYESKLEFLKGEHVQLQQKIQLKQKQLMNAQKRFSESRNKLEPFIQRQKTFKKIEKFKTMQ